MPDFAVDLTELESCRLAIVSLADEFGQLAEKLTVATVDTSGLGGSAAGLGQAAADVVTTAKTQLGAARLVLDGVARGLAFTATQFRGTEGVNAGLFAGSPGGA